jgi:hypothetical protein
MWVRCLEWAVSWSPNTLSSSPLLHQNSGQWCDWTLLSSLLLTSMRIHKHDKEICVNKIFAQDGICPSPLFDRYSHGVAVRIHTHTRTHIYTHTHAHSHTHTSPHTNTHTHAHAHAHTSLHTNTHTHTILQGPIYLPLNSHCLCNKGAL